MNLSNKANEWLKYGERGLSSELIFSVLSGINISSEFSTAFKHYPRDPDDFQRCEKLLRQVPEFREDFHKMGEISSKWKSLVEHWDEIAVQFDQEVPGIFDKYFARWSAPKTYQLMKKALEREDI